MEAVLRPRILGILNVTPDSFSDGGQLPSIEDAVGRAHRFAREGADAIDIGGESTRPGSRPVSLETELKRVVPILDALADFPLPISIDTRRAAVAAAAAERGATILNDTAALRDDPEIATVASAHQMDVVLMHRSGTPETMQIDPRYDDVISEVRFFFEERIEAAIGAGIAIDRILLDPGLGFGKRKEDNYELVNRCQELRIEGTRLLVGASRKSFLEPFDGRDPEQRLPGSLAFVARCRRLGVDWVRVHDVADTVRFLDTLEAIDEPASVTGGVV